MVSNKRRALLLGGTGAMGQYLTPMLANDGWDVTVTSRSSHPSDAPGVGFIKGSARNIDFLRDVLSNKWDVVVDFMVRGTGEFRQILDLLLSSCSQYVYLSSYRVFADSPVITERSSRLLDVSDDAVYLSTDEYALAKARQEDLLRRSGSGNWTIVRPAITYAQGRFQLCTLECDTWLPMTLAGHPVPLATEMLSKQTTMSWGGDVALMIARLSGSSEALGEDYNASDSRHQSWADVAEVYKGLVPLEVREVPLCDYEGAAGAVYQCRYDRMFDRVIDNSKILAATGLSEGELMGIEEGIPRELGACLRDPKLRSAGKRQLGRLDRLGGGFFSPRAFSALEGASPLGYMKYLLGRTVG